MTDDSLEIPPFLRRPPMSPEEHRKLLQRSKRWGKRSLFGSGAEAQPRDREGRPLPFGMDETSWALLRSLDTEARKAEAKEKREKKQRDKQRKAFLASIRPKGRRGLQPAATSANVSTGEGLPNEEATNENETQAAPTRMDAPRDKDTEESCRRDPGTEDRQAAEAH